MGEMKIEHVLLFLVGAFLVYHMMKGCGCNKVEGMRDLPKVGGCVSTQYGCCPDGKTAASQYGCCPDGKTAASSSADKCFPKLVNRFGEKVIPYLEKTYCPNKGATSACYASGQRCEMTTDCKEDSDKDPHGGKGCIVRDGVNGDHKYDIKTRCRLCGFDDYPPCPSPTGGN
jgi:hypothetical protein